MALPRKALAIRYTYCSLSFISQSSNWQHFGILIAYPQALYSIHLSFSTFTSSNFLIDFSLFLDIIIQFLLFFSDAPSDFPNFLIQLALLFHASLQFHLPFALLLIFYFQFPISIVLFHYLVLKSFYSIVLLFLLKFSLFSLFLNSGH
jgi:hypothetical protein